MARSKRPISPTVDSPKSKRIRLQPSETVQEVITIDDDDVPAPRQTRGAKPDLENDSDIEIIEDPVKIDIVKKNKGKRRAAPSASLRSTSNAVAGPSKRVIYDVDAMSISSRAATTDEEVAMRLTMEWAAEPSPEPKAGPSNHPGSIPSKALPSSSAQNHIEIVPSEESTPIPPTSGVTSDITTLKSKTGSLDVPYIKLPNPELQLTEIRTFLATDRECSKCGERVLPPRGQVTVGSVEPEAKNQHGLPPSLTSLLHFECPNVDCLAVYCRGCFKPVSCSPKCKEQNSGVQCEVAQCCAEVRAIALFEALSAFDKEHLAEKKSADSRAKANKQSATKAYSTVGPGGTGYSTGAYHDVGFALEDDEDEGEEDFDFDAFEDLDDEDFDMDDEVDMDFEMTVHNLKKASNTAKGGIQLIGGSLGMGGMSVASDISVGRGTAGSKGSSSIAVPLGIGKGRGAAVHGVSTHHNGIQRPKKADPSPENVSEGDQILIHALSLLTNLLPAPYSNDPAIYDLLPHPSLGALILMSCVPTVLAQLLRNDSVTDWIARSPVYHAMLTLLKRMADCELTIPTLVGHRPEFTSTSGLAGWMSGEGEFSWKRDESTGEVEMAVPLLEHFKKLKRQAEAFLHTATTQFANHGETAAEEPAFIEGLSLCADIVGAQGDIKKAMEALHQIFSGEKDGESHLVDVQSTYGTSSSRAGPSTSGGPIRRSARKSAREPKGKGRAKESGIQTSSFDVEKGYMAACEKLSFDYVALSTSSSSSNGLTYGGYSFETQLRQTQNSTRIPKDRIHFAKELAVMATSLPPGIWVRVDEVRNDAIKMMIAGPQGTPYAGGLFEFDCFIPLEYPNRPPLVHLRTTGRGTVRFNPNLYNCGKVCLSLLGTWPGSPEEQWTAKSTLLQVLVSIQSMILNEAPYFNEPGHGKANLKSQASIKYNRDTSLQTVRWAMLDWFKDEHRDGIWKDVIKSHFSLRRDRIREQLSTWAKDDPRMKDYHASLQPSRTTGQQPVNLEHKHFTGLRLPPPPAPSKTANMDLVAEFDAGMKRVEAWPAEG